MKNMTATEVLARQEAYKPVLAELDRRLNKILNKMGDKLALRVATNFGPILWMFDTHISTRRLPHD